ncbi:MAG: sensor histidine kinase [Eubacteriales bacterium]|nr:sensor histidine kinase [Eubacteriales bacterium]
MKGPMRYLTSPSQGKSIQFDLAGKLIVVCLAAQAVFGAVILAVSFIISNTNGSAITIGLLGFGLFSREYWLLFCGVLAGGSLVSVLVVAGFAVPYARALKAQLSEVGAAEERMARGGAGYRIEEAGCLEAEDIARRFNGMADRIAKQAEALQRLAAENKRLMEGPGEAASAQERRKLARELHDAVSQQLFAVSTMLAAIPVMMDNKPEDARKYLALAEKTAGTAQQELRALIMHLRPVSLEGSSLRQGIAKLLDELGDKNKNIRIYAELSDIEGVPEGIEDNIFRVTQEAVSNIIRHSKATGFTVKLFRKEKVLTLLIEDNGIGFSDSDGKKTSYGLRTMRERIEEIGGRFDVISFPGKGTRIEIRVPLDLQSMFG